MLMMNKAATYNDTNTPSAILDTLTVVLADADGLCLAVRNPRRMMGITNIVDRTLKPSMDLYSLSWPASMNAVVK